MKHETDVCIVGAGPAGMILGLRLAEKGVRVLVLESHEDFEREYRGEVLMPRFTQMMREIGLEEFLEKYPHLKLEELEGSYKGKAILRIGFKEISPEVPYAIWMPQPVMLQALLDKAKNLPTFQLWFHTRVTGLIQENGKTLGVTALKSKEPVEIRAKITAGTDGRFSIVRKRGDFELEYEDHRFDIIWFTIPKPEEYDNKVRFFLSPLRNYLILPKYPEHLQCGVVVEKDGYGDYVKKGIDSFRKVLLAAHPMLHPFAKSLKNFSPFNVLQAKIEYVKEWANDGVILIGDSAHTCSPAGAIGVSVAVASALVGAEVLADCLRKNDFSAKALCRLQELRAAEVRHIHSRQLAFGRLLLPRSGWQQALAPWMIRIVSKLGLFRALQRDLLVMQKPLEF